MHIPKASCFHQRYLIPHGDRSADSLRPRFGTSSQGPRQLLLEHDIGKLKNTTGLQNAEDLLEGDRLGLRQVDDAVRNDDIERRIRVGNCVSVRPLNLGICDLCERKVLPGAYNHLLGQIDPAYDALLADDVRCDIHIEPGAAAEVQDPRATPDRSERERVSHAAKGFEDPGRGAVNEIAVIAQTLGPLFPDRIFELPGCGNRNLGVFSPDRFPDPGLVLTGTALGPANSGTARRSDRTAADVFERIVHSVLLDY